MRIIPAALAALAIATPAVAQSAPRPDTVGWLLARCTATDPTNRGFCQGYIRATFITFRWTASHPALNAKLCVPDDVSLGEFQPVVLQYIRRHPELHDNHAAVAVVRAASERWPCK